MNPGRCGYLPSPTTVGGRPDAIVDLGGVPAYPKSMKLGRRFHPLISAGFVFLILASVSRWIKPHSRSVEDLHDALTGLLYGLAIACMLFGIYKSTRRPDDTGATPNP